MINYDEKHWTTDERICHRQIGEGKDAQELYGYQRLFASVSHFEDISDLDRRIHFLTFNFKPNFLMPKQDDIYLTCMKALGGKVYGRSPDRPGLIIDDDVSGTKYGVGRDENHHFHGLLTVPKSLNSRIWDEDGEHECLITPVEKTAAVLSLHTRPYDLKKSIPYVIGYSSKFVRRKKHEAYGKQFNSGEYPWALDRAAKGMREGAKKGMIFRYDNILNLFYTNPAALFSAEYMDLYGGETERLCKKFPLRNLKRSWLAL